MSERIMVVGYDLGKEPMEYLRKEFPQFTIHSFERFAKVPDELMEKAEVLMNYGDSSQIKQEIGRASCRERV